MTPASRRNPLTLMVLATLWEQPTHPYRILRILQERSKDRAAKLNYGSLYTVVATLEREGLIESTGVTQIFPSPIFSVQAALAIPSTRPVTADSSARTSTLTLGVKATWYSAPR